MIELKISGHSDDIVCYELDGSGDEFTPPGHMSSETPYMGTLLVHSKKGRCLIHVLYDGCWSFAVSKVDEDDDAFVRILSWDGYSEQLTLKVPKGTKVEWRR